MLTELAIKRTKPKEKDYKLSDEKGLFLLIKKSGAKYWRVKYRFAQKKGLHATTFNRLHAKYLAYEQAWYNGISTMFGYLG